MERVNCERYPCHFPGQDCSLCFCPFYPCRDERTGGLGKDGAWCCERCHVIHDPDTVRLVLDALMQGEPPAAVWRRLEAGL